MEVLTFGRSVSRFCLDFAAAVSICDFGKQYVKAVSVEFFMNSYSSKEFSMMMCVVYG